LSKIVTRVEPCVGPLGVAPASQIVGRMGWGVLVLGSLVFGGVGVSVTSVASRRAPTHERPLVCWSLGTAWLVAWLLWFLVYLAQMHPLVAPRRKWDA